MEQKLEDSANLVPVGRRMLVIALVMCLALPIASSATAQTAGRGSRAEEGGGVSPQGENMEPVAIAFPPSQYVSVGDKAWFTGFFSYDPDGTIVSYDWQFGDGISDSGRFVTHEYSSEGVYNVTLTVTDDQGASDADNCVVHVMENIPPVAIALPHRQFVYIGKAAWFVGFLSFDIDGRIVNYTWDFGDGSQGWGPFVTHQYKSAGLYEVTLTVTDDDGATDDDICYVKVVENLPPVAIPRPFFQVVKVGEDAHFNGSLSFDPDGTIVSYEWEFGDGTSGTGSEVSHSYGSRGCYIVRLTVTDDDGASDTGFAFVYVRSR